MTTATKCDRKILGYIWTSTSWHGHESIAKSTLNYWTTLEQFIRSPKKARLERLRGHKDPTFRLMKIYEDYTYELV